MALFNPSIPPQVDPSGQHRFRSNRVQFGDGYMAVTGDGMNSKDTTWTVTYRGTDAEINPIKAFLNTHGTHQSFEWVDPEGVLGRYLMVDGYDETPSDSGNNEIRVTLLRKNVP